MAVQNYEQTQLKKFNKLGARKKYPHFAEGIFTLQWRHNERDSPASCLFTQAFNQAQINENIKAPRHCLCEGNSTVTGEFPLQRASNSGNFAIWWRHHEIHFLERNLAIDDDSSLVYIMASRWTGHKPFSKPMIIHCIGLQVLQKDNNVIMKCIIFCLMKPYFGWYFVSWFKR